jgi:uncharacterized protein with HEPN domain
MAIKPRENQGDHRRDMLVSARHAPTHIRNVTFDQFWDDVKTRDVVAIRWRVIGEAARKIKPVTTEQLPAIPFDRMAAMRHRIAHDYGRVNFRIVWGIAPEELTPRVSELERYLAQQKVSLSAGPRPSLPPPKPGPRPGS